ncbi:MAG: hypothetical protein AAB320_01030 [Elusimicrobiota bacterium]
MTSFVEHRPRGLDGVARFPENHRLLRQSSGLKVVDVFIGAGRAERPHTHLLDSYMFTDQPAPIVVRLVDAAGRRKVVFERRRQLKQPRRPSAHPVAAEPLHYVTNTGRRDYRATRVEFKQGSGRLKDCAVAAKGVLTWRSAVEAVVVGRTGGALRLLRRVRAGWQAVEALKNGKRRPQVWQLSAGAYRLENPSRRVERVYRLSSAS